MSDVFLAFSPYAPEVCLGCDDPIETEVVTLELIGEETELFEIEAARCPDCRDWFAHLAELQAANEELELPLVRVEAFRIEDEPVQGTVWSHKDERFLSWNVFREVVLEGAERKLEQFVESYFESRRGEGAIEELAELPEVRETWAVGCRPLELSEQVEYEFGRAWLAVVVDGIGRVRDDEIYEEEPPTSGTLARLVARAAARPRTAFGAGRPYRMLLGEGVDVEALSDLLGNYLTTDPGTPDRLVEALDELSEALLEDAFREETPFD